MYDPQMPSPGNVRPEPIGHAYQTLYLNAGQTTTQSGAVSEFQIDVWDRYPYISQDQQQEVGVSLMHNNLPVKGIQPTLVLTLVDGKEMAVPMPETDADGRSTIRLEPILGPNGSLIQYEICLPVPPEQESCKEDSFVLWQTP
jgi:hypothetical protein